MKTLIITVALALMCAGATDVKAAQTREYTYVGDAPMVYYPTYRSERVDLAIKVSNPALKGKKVTRVKAKINLVDQEVTDCALWLSSALEVAKGDDGKKHAVADIWSASATPDAEGWIEASPAEPYTLTGADIYAGYSFTIPKYNKEAKSPITYSQSRHAGGFYFFSPLATTKWMDYEDNLKGVLPVYVEIEGEFQPVEVVPVGWDTEYPYAQTGSEYYLPLKVYNIGSEPFSTLSYEYFYDGYEGECGSMTLNAPVQPDIVNPSVVTLAFNPTGLKGKENMHLNISSANGKDNFPESSYITLPVEFRPLVPVQRTVMEEGTATWCSACPRGMMAIERLSELYPGRFIGVAYHVSKDPMMSPAEIPFETNAIPMAVLDRGDLIDPYYGTNHAQNEKFAILSLVDSRLRQPATAAVEATAAWTSDDSGMIDVKTDVAFVNGMDRKGYKVAFILVANGLAGKEPYWWQVNSLNGSDPDNLDNVLRPLATMGNPIKDMTFDHVAALAPENIVSELPGSLAAGEWFSVKASINADDAVSTYAETQGQSLIQHRDKVEVVALLIDPDGKVENAHKVHVSSPSAVTSIEGDAEVISTEWYDLQGIRHAVPPAGIHIKVDRLSDGSIRSRKSF